jgi:hypothetical protein
LEQRDLRFHLGDDVVSGPVSLFVHQLPLLSLFVGSDAFADSRTAMRRCGCCCLGGVTIHRKQNTLLWFPRDDDYWSAEKATTMAASVRFCSHIMMEAISPR